MMKNDSDTGEKTNSTEPPLDLVHLSRQTMNDANLREELLALFVGECVNTRKILSSAPKAIVLIEASHKIQGAAKAVGAWSVAHWGELLELDPENSENLVNLTRELCLVEAFIRELPNTLD